MGASAAGTRTRGMMVIALCAALTVAAGCSAERARGPGTIPAAGEVQPNARELGFAGDPWQIDDWADAVGARPTLVMEFEQWYRDRTLDEHFDEARQRGLSSFMVTWEPWVPVLPSIGEKEDARYAEQPTYSNAAIAAGELDDYLRDFARSVAASGLTVYIRHGHEMNGNWYPWSRDPESYVLAWRHIVDIFRAEGATNAQFVFSPNPSMYLEDDAWREAVEPYWPGAGYVDLLGATMVSFGGQKDYSVAEIAERIELLHEMYGMDVILSEVNTAFEGRVKWFTDLRTWLATQVPWVRGVVLSQADSRGQLEFGGEVGDLAWNVVTDPETQPVVRGMIEDLSRRPEDRRPGNQRH